MDLADMPFEFADLGSEWLELFEEAGVDVVEYLRVERAIHSNGSNDLPKIRLSGLHLRERVLIISGEGERVDMRHDWAMALRRRLRP